MDACAIPGGDRARSEVYKYVFDRTEGNTEIMRSPRQNLKLRGMSLSRSSQRAESIVAH